MQIVNVSPPQLHSKGVVYRFELISPLFGCHVSRHQHVEIRINFLLSKKVMHDVTLRVVKIANHLMESVLRMLEMSFQVREHLFVQRPAQSFTSLLINDSSISSGNKKSTLVRLLIVDVRGQLLSEPSVVCKTIRRHGLERLK